jgi:hypothetical protein
MAIPKKTKEQVGVGIGEKRTLIHRGWGCKLYSRYGKQCGVFLKCKNRTTI